VNSAQLEWLQWVTRLAMRQRGVFEGEWLLTRAMLDETMVLEVRMECQR
jgi:hypothetical protein